MAITATEARKRLFPLIQQVNDDADAVEILSKNGTAFLVSEAQWRSLQETAFLLRSPANARRLIDAIDNINAGRVQTHELPDPEDEASMRAFERAVDQRTQEAG